MNEQVTWRRRARGALRSYFRRHSFPRFALGLVVIATGYIGFGISFGLLEAGVGQMWIRYPVAVIGAYCAFLALLRLWTAVERARFDEKAFLNAASSPEEVEERIRPSDATWRKSDRSWLDWLDLHDGSWFEDVDADGCLVGLLIGAVVALVTVLVLAVFNTAIIEEVFLDTFLISVLYRRLRIASRRHWLGTAIRKTLPLAGVVALLLGIIGACLQQLAPDARSIGPAVRYLMKST